MVVPVLLSFTSCQSTKGLYGDSPEVYTEINGQKSITFNPDGTFLFEYTDEYLKSRKLWLNKELSFGSWRKEDGVIILNSSEKIKSSRLEMIVEENITDTDSLIIQILSPYESDRQNKKLPAIFKYVLLSSSMDPLFSQDLEFISPNQQFPLERKYGIHDIVLFIIPDPFLYPGQLEFNFLHGRYSVKNSLSNHFIIDIPDFTLEYIGYIRFKEEYVKVIDKNIVQLRGEKFKKK